jgi:hypothetical protein
MKKIVQHTALATPLPNETFSFGALKLDVSQANNLIYYGLVKAPIRKFDATAYAKRIGVSIDPKLPFDEANQALSKFMYIDYAHAARLTDQDLNRPGILVETDYGHVLIDGNSRLFARLHSNVANMQAHVIDKAHLAAITPGTAAYAKASEAVDRRKSDVQTRFDMQGDVEGKFTGGPVEYDQKDGIGNIPDSQSIKYMGFAVMMKPSQFAKLVTETDFATPESKKTIKYITAQMHGGKPIGSPWLEVDLERKVPVVVKHEGRHRMEAIAKLHGDIPVLVHVFSKGDSKARLITPQQIAAFRSNAMHELTPAQKSLDAKGKPTGQVRVTGPNFERRVWHLKGWTDIAKPQATTAAFKRVLVAIAAGPQDINVRYKRDLLSRFRDMIDDMDFFGTDLDSIKTLETLLKTVTQQRMKKPDEANTAAK